MYSATAPYRMCRIPTSRCDRTDTDCSAPLALYAGTLYGARPMSCVHHVFTTA